jgi:hypothetical protein
MLAIPLTPGVYVQRSDYVRAEALPLRSDIASFVGIAEKGPIGLPVAVETVAQFTSLFGGYIAGGSLAYCVRAFFENGGTRCRIVRVASDDFVLGARAASISIPDDNTPTANEGFVLYASSAGSWGNALQVSVAAVTRGETMLEPPQDLTRSRAASVAAFGRGTLVRLRQPGKPPVYRLVAAADPATNTVFWVTENGGGAPWEKPLDSLDPTFPVRAERVDHDIVVRDKGRLAAIYSGLQLIPESPRAITSVLAPLDDSQVRDEVPPPPPLIVAKLDRAPSVIPRPAGTRGGEFLPLTGGSDGLAALTYRDFIGSQGNPLDDDETRRRKRKGVNALAEARDVSLIAVPDIVARPAPITLFDPIEPPAPCAPCPVLEPPAPPPPRTVPELPPVFSDEAIFAVQSAAVDLAERLADRVVLLDPPCPVASSSGVGLGGILSWRQRFDSSYAALMFPWCRVPDPVGRGELRAIPPSGHAAGLIAAADIAAGVPRTGANRMLVWCQDLTVALAEAAHGGLNEASVTVLRAADGRPARMLGARAITSLSAFRFLVVRRLIAIMRRTLEIITQWAVFAPNNPETWTLLEHSIRQYLETLRQRGALAGATPDAAYSVRCDATVNTPQRRDVRALVAAIAIAPSIPFEFIVLRLGRVREAFELAETSAPLPPLVSGGVR